MKICCFGDTFSNTYAAAAAFFGGGSAHCEILCCETICETLRKVQDGECDACVVPLENSVEGTVTESADTIADTGLFITGEIVMPVKHSLIAGLGVKLGDVERVYSHPQALAQCRKNLQRLLPDAACVPVPYTSAGLDMLDRRSAAIARVPKEGQVVLADGMEDSDTNCTRFVAVRKTPASDGDKVSVAFSTRNESGALLRALEVLYARRINMTKIESRPAKKKMGQYVFFVDFLPGGEVLDDVMGELAGKCEELRFLGRYRKSDK